jgi:hypothetical protein
MLTRLRNWREQKRIKKLRIQLRVANTRYREFERTFFSQGSFDEWQRNKLINYKVDRAKLQAELDELVFKSVKRGYEKRQEG